MSYRQRTGRVTSGRVRGNNIRAGLMLPIEPSENEDVIIYSCFGRGAEAEACVPSIIDEAVTPG